MILRKLPQVWGFFREMYRLFHLENSQSQTVRLMVLVKAITVSLPSSCLRSETCNILTCHTGPLVSSFLARWVTLELLVSLAYAELYALCLFLVLHQKLSLKRKYWSNFSFDNSEARSPVCASRQGHYMQFSVFPSLRCLFVVNPERSETEMGLLWLLFSPFCLSCSNDDAHLHLLPC